MLPRNLSKTLVALGLKLPQSIRSPPFRQLTIRVSRVLPSRFAQDRTARDLEKTEREIRRVIEAIKAGVPGAAVKDEMASLETRRIDLFGQLESAPPPMPRLTRTLPSYTEKRS